ncbi:MAG: MerR family transcriptional regulator [Ignavibacteriales bacterium]
MKALRTSDVARAVGVHPNTVRLYESMGFLPAVPRGPNGYRLFSEFHLDQVRLVWIATRCTWLGGDIRRTALAVISLSRSGRLALALRKARDLLVLVREEVARAEEAAEFLERWATQPAHTGTAVSLRIGEVAKLVGATRDMLRGWERDGLIRVPRDPDNGYREYGSAEIDRLRVIRMLRQARYSTMSILRIMLRLDRGQKGDLRSVLDTPPPEEDVYYAADRWLSALADLEAKARDLVALTESMLRKHS